MSNRSDTFQGFLAPAKTPSVIVELLSAGRSDQPILRDALHAGLLPAAGPA